MHTLYLLAKLGCSMKFLRIIFLSLLMVGIVTGCTDTGHSGTSDGEDLYTNPPERPCGSPLLLSVHGDGPSLGVFEVMNDTVNFWLSFSHTNRYRLEKVNAFVGSDINFPTLTTGLPNPDDFSLIEKGPFRNGKWSHYIPLDKLPNCPTLSIRLELIDLEKEDGENKVVGWAIPSRENHRFRFSYCKQSCFRESVCDGVEKGEFRTVPINGWNKPESASNKLLLKKFESIFPDGIEIGCNYGIELGKASSVVEMLSHSGEANQLEEHYGEGMESKIANEFANQLCALALNLGFDERSSGFASSREKIRSLVVTRGPFKGWTVAEIFNEANTVLGGCTSSYSPHQMVDVLAEINNNFLENETPKGYLACPE